MAHLGQCQGAWYDGTLHRPLEQRQACVSPSTGADTLGPTWSERLLRANPPPLNRRLSCGREPDALLILSATTCAAMLLITPSEARPLILLLLLLLPTNPCRC